jgi:hypothetical protein
MYVMGLLATEAFSFSLLLSSQFDITDILPPKLKTSLVHEAMEEGRTALISSAVALKMDLSSSSRCDGGATLCMACTMGDGARIGCGCSCCI